MNTKLSLVLGIALAASTSATAQQLPNYGFENWKSSCGISKQVSSNKKLENKQRPGVEPSDWEGSSVNQSVSVFTAKKELVFSDDAGYSGKCCKLQNLKAEVSGIGAVAPGFINFGTPWVYAEKNISNCDGGTIGGLSFSNTPDAITGQFKRTDSKSENSYIVAYLWSGTFNSKIGKVGSPGVACDDVDRAIMGRITPTSSGTLVASCNYSYASTNNAWQEITVPLEYQNPSVAPQKMNVIISAGDYWSRTNLVEGTTLFVDNVKFLYYSRLASLNIGGAAVSGFDSKTYSYNVNGSFDANPAYTVLGASPAKAVTVSNNPAAWSQSIRVANTNTGTGVTDYDGAAEHTYTIQYARESRAGYASVIEDQVGTEPVANTGYFGYYYNSDKLNIKVNIDGVGEVVIDGLTRKNDGSDVYAATGIYLNGEENWTFCSDYIVYGDGNDFIVNIIKDGKIYVWTTNNELSGVGAIGSDAAKVIAKAGAISITGANGVADIYTIDGRIAASVEVSGAAEVSLAKGIYLVRIAGKTTKVVVK